MIDREETESEIALVDELLEEMQSPHSDLYVNDMACAEVDALMLPLAVQQAAKDAVSAVMRQYRAGLVVLLSGGADSEGGA